ncbi:MAG: hypothetical protein IT223_00015 [Crocinitomicaceae bacterium]|nr:hypothetical protein [Crocinitomicaceae bacterium]
MKKFTFLVFIALFISGVSFAQIQNGGFEMGPATGNGWIESSTHFITLMCDEASCGTCGGRCLPQAGSCGSPGLGVLANTKKAQWGSLLLSRTEIQPRYLSL